MKLLLSAVGLLLVAHFMRKAARVWDEDWAAYQRKTAPLRGRRD